MKNRLNNFQSNIIMSNKERLILAKKIQKEIYRKRHDYQIIKRQIEIENKLKIKG